MSDLYSIPVAALDGTPGTLEPYRGRVLLVVNVASRCGFTPQYAGLEALHRAHTDAGFAVLGFPCNQFLGQEPGDADAIRSFCSAKYDVTFPLFAKVDVNGPAAHPLFRWLTERAPGTLGTRGVKWNFTKFLIDGTGTRVKRFGFMTPPVGLTDEITGLLKAVAVGDSR